MKKLLLTLVLLLMTTSNAFAANATSAPENMEVKQKACQNVFSLINIDLSLMSPRAQAADISVSDLASKAPEAKKGEIVPIANKTQVKENIPTTKNKTSLFRLDLLHIFKIQVL
jgi:hypothetical protein